MFNFFNNTPETQPICGGRHETQLEGYSEDIKSKDIKSFSYVGRNYSVSAKKENEKIEIFATGGGEYNRRDGSYFIIKYNTEDDSILKSLQEVIDHNNETKGNGHTTHVDGLPPGIGDTLNVEYESGEKLYKYSNQFPTCREESATSFYNIFHQFVVKDGYEFTSEGSNVKLFDDADEEYLQGTWKGKHFGDEVEVTFNKNHLTITVAGRVTDDDVEYIISEGFVKPNILKEGKEGKTHYDYEDFKGASGFSKKNYFTMTAYFYENESSSSCDIMNFDKEKPADEE